VSGRGGSLGGFATPLDTIRWIGGGIGDIFSGGGGDGGRPLQAETIRTVKNHLNRMYGLGAVPDGEVGQWLDRAYQIDTAAGKGQSFYGRLAEYALSQTDGDGAAAQAYLKRLMGIAGYSRFETAKPIPTSPEGIFWDKIAKPGTPVREHLNTGARLDPKTGQQVGPEQQAGLEAGGNKTYDSWWGGSGGSKGPGGSGIYDGDQYDPNGFQAGPGPGGQQVTPQLLREFVDSNPYYALNAMTNKFRSAGAAALFMDWLTDRNTQARLLGEFEGFIAQQAMGGQVPKGSFSTWLETRTGMPILSPEVRAAEGVNPFTEALPELQKQRQQKTTGATGSTGSTGQQSGAGSNPNVPPLSSTGTANSGAYQPGSTPQQPSEALTNMILGG